MFTFAAAGDQRVVLPEAAIGTVGAYAAEMQAKRHAPFVPLPS